MYKVLILSVFLVSCASRGMSLSEQMPEEFMKKYEKGVFSENEKIIGFVYQDKAFKEQNIIFISEAQKNLYQEMKSLEDVHVALINDEGLVYGVVTLDEVKSSKQRDIAVSSYSKSSSGYISESKGEEKFLSRQKKQNVQSPVKKNSSVLSFKSQFERSNLTIDSKSLGVVFYSEDLGEK